VLASTSKRKRSRWKRQSMKIKMHREINELKGIDMV